MGNCCRIKTLPYKFSDNDDQPTQDNIHLESNELITSIASNSNSWCLVQDTNLNLYKSFSMYGQISLPERIRSLHLTESLVIYGGRSIHLSGVSKEPRGILLGHERMVTSLDCESTRLASGSSDWSVRLWDLTKLEQLSSCTINWNVVTSLKFRENLIVQTSEDLRMRIWDVRQPTISVNKVIVTGDNFADCCDFDHIKGIIVTGHRGFNGIGCECKIWDLRKINEPVKVIKDHEEAVQGVKFLNGKLVTCGKDGKVFVYSEKFDRVGHWEHKEKIPFCAMDGFADGILVANIEPKVEFFKLDHLIKG